MQLTGPLDRLLASNLPHEVTHTVFADHLKAAVPRWADEGAAILAEDEDERQRHDRLARRLLSEGRTFGLRRLLAMRDFPSDAMVLYAQGYSVTHFLVERKGPRTFAQFVAEGVRAGWDEALQEHYGFRSVEELEAAWLASLGSRTQVAPTATSPTSFEADQVYRGGPGPYTALARLDAEGRLIVRLPTVTYEPVTSYVRRAGETREEEVTSYVAKTRLGEQRYDPSTVKVLDLNGQVVDAARLRRALREEVAVLVSADGAPVDPFHLRVVKEGTLLLLLPPAPVSRPPLEPPPRRP
jgi:hypothetical protein